MSFVYRNSVTGAVFTIAEKACLCPTAHADLIATEVEDDFQTLLDRATATGAPDLMFLTFDPVTQQFAWTIDLFALEIEVEGEVIDANVDTIQIEGDGVSHKLITIKKKNLRTGEYQTAAEDNDTIQLWVGRGRLRNQLNAQNISEVTLVNGVASFRIRSVDETAKSRLTMGDLNGVVYGSMVALEYV